MEGQSSAAPRHTLTLSAYRNMAGRVQSYPWKTDLILTRDHLEGGWGLYDHEGEWASYHEIERLAGKVSACEKAIFCGRHSAEIMATRRHLGFELYEEAPTTPLRQRAAETTRSLTSISHGNAPARGNSLLASYRLLDVFATLYYRHPQIQRRPAEKPIYAAASTQLLNKFGSQLFDIGKLLNDFKASWEHSRKSRRANGKASTNDVLLTHIKQTLTIEHVGHAQNIERNLLAAALPVMIMFMDQPLAAVSNDAVPLPPEMLDGLDEFVQTKYMHKDCFSAIDKAKIADLFTKANIRNMRKPHAVSVHVSPVLNLLNVNWQRAEVTEEDIIQTSRLVGTHDNDFLELIERRLWHVIISIAKGTSPVDAIDEIIDELPWEQIDLMDSEDDINQCFKPNPLPVDLTQHSPSRAAQINHASESPNPDPSPPKEPAPPISVSTSAPQAASKRKRKTGKNYRVEADDFAPILPSTTARDIGQMDALDPSQPYPLSNVAKDWTLFDPLGVPHRIRPIFHDSETRDYLSAIQDIIESLYRRGKPRFICARDESVIQVITSKERRDTSAREIQQQFRRRHIVEVQGQQTEPRNKFDLRTLATLGPLDRPVVVQDESIPSDLICRSFTLRGLFDIRDSGRAVRTLEMPVSLHAQLGDFSTDRRAFEYRRFCPEKDHTNSGDRQFPIGRMEWSLVSLRGATREVSISPDGTGTFLECLAGAEWYILLRPKGSLDHQQFGNIKLYQQTTGRLDDFVRAHFEVEAFLLCAGMRCFIRPNTPYLVLTVDHSIVHGSYFYTLTTMQDTFFALVHNFASTSSITQSRIGQPSRHVIRTVVQYVYQTLVHRVDAEMPPLFSHAIDRHLLTTADLEDILSVVSIGILSNVLEDCSRTPLCRAHDNNMSEHLSQARWDKYDYNALRYDDRVGCTLARGFAYEIRDWLCHFYSIEGDDLSESTMAITQRIIAHQASVLFKAKLAAAPHQSPDAVKHQLLNLFPRDSAESTFLANNIARIEQGMASSDMYISLADYTISQIDEPAEFRPRTIDEIRALGMSPLDELYETGRQCSFEIHVEGKNKKRHTD